MRDQSQRCGVVRPGLTPPRLTVMPQRALRQAAARSFARNRTKESVGIFSLLEKERMWRGGHKSAVKLTLALFLFRTLLADWPLQVGHVVDGDGDELPAVVAGFGEEVEVGFLTRQVAEVDFAVFPLGHCDSKHFSNGSARKC